MSYKICDYCGKPFRVTRKHLKYCSTECYNRARKEYKHNHYLQNKSRYNTKRNDRYKDERRKNRLDKQIKQLERKKKIEELGLTPEKIDQRRNEEELKQNEWIPSDILSFDTNLEEILNTNNEMINALEDQLLKELGDIKE